MAIIVVLITVSLFVLSRQRLNAVAGKTGPANQTLTDGDLRLARLRLPAGWRQAYDLNEGAGVQAIDALHGRHVIVISESLEDYAPGVTVQDHANITLGLLVRGIHVVGISDPRHVTVDGYEAIQYEIEGFHDNTWVKYLHTTVGGRRAFHQIIGWATQSRYDRAVFESILEGFSEAPGAEPVRRPPPRGARIPTLPVSTRIH